MVMLCVTEPRQHIELPIDLKEEKEKSKRGKQVNHEEQTFALPINVILEQKGVTSTEGNQTQSEEISSSDQRSQDIQMSTSDKIVKKDQPRYAKGNVSVALVDSCFLPSYDTRTTGNEKETRFSSLSEEPTKHQRTDQENSLTQKTNPSQGKLGEILTVELGVTGFREGSSESTRKQTTKIKLMPAFLPVKHVWISRLRRKALPWLFIWISFFCFCCTSEAQTPKQIWKTSCGTNNAVLKGDPSSVTCHFEDNVRKYRFHFNVIRYDFGNLDPLADLILSCIWSDEKDNPSCVSKAGYSFDPATVGNNVTIKILATQEHHAGRYQCRDATTLAFQQKGCTLAIKGLNVFCALSAASSVYLGTSTAITCHYNSDLIMTREDYYVYKFPDNNSKPVKVLDCEWDPEKENAIPDCKVAAGYTHELSSNGRDVKLNINYATEFHSGRYSCRTIPYNKKVKVSDCRLNVQAPTTTLSTLTAATKTESFHRHRFHHNVQCQSKLFVREGQPVHMTCLTPKDIDSRTADIGVMRVVRNDKSSDIPSYDTILRCFANSKCYWKDGYDLVNHGRDAITISISSFTGEHEGKYLCTFKENIYEETPMTCLFRLNGQDTNQAAQLKGPGSLVMIFLLLTCVYAFHLVASVHSMTPAPYRGVMA